MSGPEPGVADQSGRALSEGVDVAVDLGGTFDGAARDTQEVEVYGQEELAHDLQVRLGKQNMDVRHAAGNRILDRDHGQLGLPAGNQLESVLEAGAGSDAFQLGEHLLTRDIGVGAGFTLVRNLLGHSPYGFSSGASSPNWIPSVSLRDVRPGLKMRFWSLVDVVALCLFSGRAESAGGHTGNLLEEAEPALPRETERRCWTFRRVLRTLHRVQRLAYSPRLVLVWYHEAVAMNLRVPEELDWRLEQLAAEEHTSKSALLLQGAELVLQRHRRSREIGAGLDFVMSHDAELLTRLEDA